jgi:hypothetical protein
LGEEKKNATIRDYQNHQEVGPVDPGLGFQKIAYDLSRVTDRKGVIFNGRHGFSSAHGHFIGDSYPSAPS